MVIISTKGEIKNEKEKNSCTFAFSCPLRFPLRLHGHTSRGGGGGSAVDSDTSSSSSAETPDPTPSTISFEQEFSSGNYTAGIDFPAGKYDIVAVSGGGNVSSSNAFDGGINAVMGTEDKNELMDMYEQEYSNIDLPDGTTLTISGVQIQLVPSV